MLPGVHCVCEVVQLYTHLGLDFVILEAGAARLELGDLVYAFLELHLLGEDALTETACALEFLFLLVQQSLQPCPHIVDEPLRGRGAVWSI